jgi:radical SAM superfamily enzyme YgiQ (UPF0313 family)
MKLLNKRLRILLVNPATPDSYWGFQHAAWFLGAKAAHIPLPLITVAALLPQDWELELIDLNIEKLSNRQLLRADAVLLTGMIIQRDSLKEVLERCQAMGVPTVVGGPFVSSTPEHEDLKAATARVIGEAEDEAVLEPLIADLESGSLQPEYRASGLPKMETSPVPRFDLVKKKAYTSMAIQVSRGCPHNCEFCNVRALFGRRPRCKTPEQVTAELDALYRAGWRENIFVVDDNFIGNIKVTTQVVRAIDEWQARHGRPFLFFTEADIRLANKPQIVEQMTQAGFFAVFIGFETASEEALKAASKLQNLNIDTAAAVRELRQRGLLVYGGFIVGFDADGLESFGALQQMIDRCQIDFAMAGLLTAIPGTPLEERVRREGRLLDVTGANNFADSNIVPAKMSRLELVRGYRELLARLYEPRQYFRRAAAAIKEWRVRRGRRPSLREVWAVVKSLIRQGVLSNYSLHYWKFMIQTFLRNPRKISRAFAAAISGHHFFWYTRKVVLPQLQAAEQALLNASPEAPNAID